MATLESILDDAQTYLHDNGVVWSRAELLRWANDGYRQLLSQSAAVVRPWVVDMPPRVAASFTQDWELTEHPGTYRIWTRSVTNRPIRATFLWEAEQLEGVTPTNAYTVTTQLWEESYTDDTDAHQRVALPRQTQRPLKVYWDSKRLAHTSVRELDETYTRWWREAGEPLATHLGIGVDHSLEIYLLQTDYVQTWNLGASQNGVPRAFSSDASRTYETDSAVASWDYAYTSSTDSGFASGLGLLITETVVNTTSASRGLFSWEADLTATTNDANGHTAGTIPIFPFEDDLLNTSTLLGVGVARWLKSSDRQYIGVAYDSGQDLMGTPRRIASSDDSLTVWDVVLPDRALTEYDEPDLVPTQFSKYIRFYILAQAFGRKGEGNRPDMEQHYIALFQLGVGLLAMLGTPSVLDRVYAREQVRDASIQAPPRVRFPATFPRAY